MHHDGYEASKNLHLLEATVAQMAHYNRGNSATSVPMDECSAV